MNMTRGTTYVTPRCLSYMCLVGGQGTIMKPQLPGHREPAELKLWQ